MANVKMALVTFNGTAQTLDTIFPGIRGVGKVYIEPVKSNTHVAYVGTASLALGTSTDDQVIKQLAIPVSATGILDNWLQDLSSSNHNDEILAQYAVDGTSGEKVRVTIWQE